jgi:16S rRNA (guanine527-N7)-methyltransferase
VESLSRKAAFITEVAGRLELDNVMVANMRAERLAAERAFDCVVSRAAGKLKDVVPVAMEMMRPKGQYVALKASDVAEEEAAAREALRRSAGRLVETVSVEYPVALGGEGGASLVVIQKL